MTTDTRSPTRRRSSGGRPPTLPKVAGEMLHGIARHRLLTSAQLRDLYLPHAIPRWTSRQLTGLADSGFIGWTRYQGPAKMWWLTRAGADEVGGGARPMTARAAASRVHQHTLDVNKVGVVLTVWARQHGDVFGPGSWEHEVKFRYIDGQATERFGLLFADALLQYEQHPDGGSARFFEWFLELDRATESIQRVGAQLRAYVRLHNYVPRGLQQPAWRERHVRFPPVLIVLTGAPRPALERRTAALVDHCRRDPMLAGQQAVRVQVCLLDDLVNRGPYAPIFLNPLALDGEAGEASRDGQLRFVDHRTNLFGQTV